MPTSMSESSLRIIVFPSLFYSYFERDIEEDEIHKALLIKQEKGLLPFANSYYFGVTVIGCVC